MTTQEIFYVIALFVLTFFILFIAALFVLLIRMKNKVKKFFSGNQLKEIIKAVSGQVRNRGSMEDLKMPPGQFDDVGEQEEKFNWYIENAPLGKFLGYPECCIKEFCDQPPHILDGQWGEPSQSDKDRYQASLIKGEYSGFIPCKKHAAEILQGKITLESLIQNRDKNIPAFPNF